MNMGDKLTSSKLSAELTSIVRDKLELGSEERVSVRVLLEEDAILEKVTVDLEGNGLKIKDIQEGPDVVITGTLAVQNIPAITSVSEVDRIEYDRSS
jgi:ACT domain-containing protein